MTNYNNLMKDYKEKLDDLSPEEAMSLLESLIRKMYDAYEVYDLDGMKKYHDEIEETMDILDSKFNNIRNYVWRTQLFYETSLAQYKLRKSVLRDSYNFLISFSHLLSRLESDFIHLHAILRTYYFNYSNNNIDEITGHLLVEHDMEDVCEENINEELWDRFGVNYFLMGNLDNLIGNVRDSMLETMKIIEERYYSPNDSQEVLNESILDVKNHVHDLIKDDFYRYQREKGIVDVELGWIDIYRIEHDLNQAYKNLKKRIDDTFEGDNGFNHIKQIFHEINMENNPNLKREDYDDKWYPNYNIMETTFIPPESRKDDKMWEKYFRWKNRE